MRIPLPACSKRRFLAIALLTFSLLLPASPIPSGQSALAYHLPEEETRALEVLVRAYRLTEQSSLERMAPMEIAKSAIGGMLQAIDPYSQVLTEADLKRLESQSSGRFLGLGIYLKNTEQGLWITKIMPDSPAAKAGLLRGDRVLKIDGLPPRMGKGSHPFSHLEVTEGRKVGLLLERDRKKLERELTMAWVPYPAIRFLEPLKGVALVELSEFQTQSADLLFERLNRTKPKVLLLDLRDNPGGLLVAAVEMAELFLDQGKIVELKNREGRTTEVYRSKGFRRVPEMEVAILLNANSASAAEILAGALQDHQKATLIGEQSFGKARVQNLYPLGEGLYAKMTIAYYHTPRGEHFDQKGLTPDLPVSESLTAELYSEQDQIYQRALDWAKERLNRAPKERGDKRR